MRFSKKMDIELQRAHTNENIEEYVRVKRLRAEKSPFDRYRDKLMGGLIKKEPRLGDVLDIGCNIGDMAKFYKGKSDRIVLCDLDKFIIRGSRIANPDIDTIDLVCGNIKNLPFKNSHFDTIVSLETIEHVTEKEQEAVFGEMIRVARPHARIYISTPNRFSLSRLEGRIIECFVKDYKWDAWDPDHKYVYYAWDLVKFIKKFDKTVKLKSVYGSYFLPGSTIVRLPLFMQKFLGFLSYLIARSVGMLFPFKYMGFTVIVVLEKI